MTVSSVCVNAFTGQHPHSISHPGGKEMKNYLYIFSNLIFIFAKSDCVFQKFERYTHTKTPKGGE